MKKIYLLITSAFFVSAASNSQNLILNGSFESNTASGNTTNLTNNWLTTVSDSYGVDGGVMDLITSNSCGTASDGNWYVTCSNVSGGWPYMAFSFRLSTTLTFGAQYTLTFDKRYCGPNSSPIDIGVSNDSSLMGTAVHTFSAPLNNSWSSEYYVFQAPLAAKFLTVNVGVAGGTGTVGLDKFSLQPGVVGIDELLTNNISLFPNPSNGIVTITGLNKNSEIEIYNFTGQKILNATMENMETEIDLSKKSKGIYFYKIIYKNEIVKEGKLTIQ